MEDGLRYARMCTRTYARTYVCAHDGDGDDYDLGLRRTRPLDTAVLTCASVARVDKLGRRAQAASMADVGHLAQRERLRT